MTAPTQAEVRSWARLHGMTVNERGSLPAAVVQAFLAATGGSAAAAPSATPTSVAPSAPPAGTLDLAGGLRSFLDSIEAEVQAVTSLSERIDTLVAELNDVRDQQARRLLVLDELKASVSDQSLGVFLDRAIRPRRTRVPEVVPERLQ